jgi:hypothetical protein
VSTLTRPTPAATVSLAMVHAMIDYVRSKGYDSDSGALGIRGRLGQTEAVATEHNGRDVSVVYCESSLAARETLLEWRPDRWLVIVTERSEDDLGAGVLAHLVGQQLRSPDPWQAVRSRFQAVAIDAQLTSGRAQRGIANGLLEVAPLGGWPPAPAGVLSRDHAFGSVARVVLDLGPGTPDVVSVLGWSTRPGITARLAELRETGGDELADAVLDWIAATTGDAAPIVSYLIRHGRPAELVPLGLVIGFLDGEADERSAADLAIARLAYRWGGDSDQDSLERAVRAIGAQAETVIATLLTDSRTSADAERAIASADNLVREARAEGVAERSDLLRLGLSRRFHRLADLLRSAPVRGLDLVEEAWRQVGAHRLGWSDPRTPAFLGAVRLARWLAVTADDAPRADLAALARRQAEVDGWVDSAVNDAAAGVDDPDLGAGLARVLELTRDVRDRHDVEFAGALAVATANEEGAEPGYLEHDGGRAYLLENALASVVFPLVRDTPVLLLILDGMSTGVATEILDDMLNRPGVGWAERLPDGSSRRAAGLAVLPTITEVSRASLLCGELTTGQQDAERRGYTRLTAAHGFRNAPLFHKKPLDTARLGFSLADDVRTAIDDVSDCPLVTCVLNTIDDALDRSDPAGTSWTADTVKHLRPLMERARESGRTVILTSDHGHVVERRLGVQRSHSGSSAARYRLVDGEVRPDEVLVAGPRVLAPGGRAVLAVSERLRYGPLKAGYHGGASPAEVVVPIVILVPAELATSVERLAPPQEPSWWSMPAVTSEAAGPQAETRQVQPPTLFDEPVPVAAPPVWGDRVISSPVYREQQQLAGRVTLTVEQVAAVLNRLVAASDRRLSAKETATALGLAPVRLAGAVEQLRKLLNVESYPVISKDPATGALILDLDLAVEQFQVPR